MSHSLRPPKQISYEENGADPIDFVKEIKEEPLDAYEGFGVKNELFEYQNNIDYSAQNNVQYSTIDPYDPSTSNIWSLLVKRCRFLLQEEHQHNQMNSYLLTKILVKEVNELLSNVVSFFQDCCVTVNQEENYSETTLEVDGLLVNCLPCHPQNTSCFYRISTDIPDIYLETLYCPLEGEIDNTDYDVDNYLPLAPEVEMDIKKEVKDVKKVKKKKVVKTNKDGTPKAKKVHMCDLCGKDLKTSKELRNHISAVHEKKRPWKCNKCGFTYRHRSGLLGHKKTNCSGAPPKTRKLIFWGKQPGTDPKCIHPDCVDKDLPKFTFHGIMNHIIDAHSPDPDDSVSSKTQCFERI